MWADTPFGFPRPRSGFPTTGQALSVSPDLDFAFDLAFDVDREGHGFSRAVKPPQINAALAAEGPFSPTAAQKSCQDPKLDHFPVTHCYH